MPRSPPWTDLHQIWQSRGGRRSNQLYQIFGDRSRGVDSVGGGKNCPLPLTRPVAVNTSALAVITVTTDSTVGVFCNDNVDNQYNNNYNAGNNYVCVAASVLTTTTITSNVMYYTHYTIRTTECRYDHILPTYDATSNRVYLYTT